MITVSEKTLADLLKAQQETNRLLGGILETLGGLQAGQDSLLRFHDQTSDKYLKMLEGLQVVRHNQLNPPETTSQFGIQKHFPSDLTDKLNFTDEGEFVKVKPTKFLGMSTFAKVADIVKGLNGEYVSAGKESHFKVPKEA